MPPMLLAFLLIAQAGGTLAGRVTLQGLAPKLANLPVTRDMKVCGTSKPDESLEVKDSGVKNTVIWFTDVPLPTDHKAPKQKLDQQACAFSPHVLVAPLGSTVDVVNSDKALHNVRAQAGEVKLMNYAMPIPGHVVPTRLKKEGIFKVSCDVHPWMRAWMLVLPTAAFAVTDEDGKYAIKDVPPGRHKIKIWHERLGEKDAELEIAAGQTATHDVQYTPR
jgi:plastocyanin